MVEVERQWLQADFLGRDAPFEWCDDDDPDRDFHPGPDDTLAVALAAYRREIAASDIVIAGAALDDMSRTAPGGRDRANMRWILVHLIEELARHCGHADLIRQSIDGNVGD
jgi:Protein of unknown function (DUF664)